ncbi:protein kinase [Basidiobolus ranarum]|uniref:Protein kinase n=1 Tax=Basidiobolus ranarum TaxID=34480 RepID=A0ABR2VZ03_9FUNG
MEANILEEQTASSLPREQPGIVYEEYQGPITDMTSIELDKENIQPTRRGRSAAALAQVFESSADERSQYLQQRRTNFENELESLGELDDPLDVYHRYVKWTIENYPQGHNQQSNLVPLLERATRHFLDDKRYVNDPRYLRMWLLYAQQVRDPKVIFSFLIRNNIGMDLAAFYEEYSDLLESLNRLDQADEILQLGINRKAQPLERLLKRYKEFQRRMTLSVAQEEDQPNTSQLTERNRSVLGRKVSSTRSAHPNLGASAGQGRDRGGIRSGMPLAQKPNKKLSIFSDTESGRSVVPDSSAAPWSDLGTDVSRRKENIREATKWKGVTLSQTSRTRVQPTERLEIFQDEELEKSEAKHLSLNPNALVDQTQKPSEDGLLFNDPLRNFPKQEPSGNEVQSNNPRKPLTSARLPSQTQKTGQKEQPSKGRPKAEKMIVDTNSVYQKDKEISLEEMRASLEQYRYQDVHYSTSTCNTKTEISNNQSLNSSQMPSPTINTKAALADIMEIFNQPLQHENNQEYSSMARTSHTKGHSFQTPPKSKSISDESTREKGFTIFQDADARILPSHQGSSSQAKPSKKR